MTQAAGRKRALIGLTAGALLGLSIFAPTASAAVGELTETVGSTTTKVTEPVKETVKQTTEPVKQTTEPVVTTGGGVVETVDKVGTKVDDTTGGSTYDQTKETVKTTTEATGDTLQKTTGTVGNTITETGGGLVGDPDLNLQNPLAGKTAKNDKKSGSKKTSGSNTGTAGSRQSQLAALRDTRERMHARLASVTASERNRRPGPSIPAAAIAPQRESFFTQLAEAAGEAAKKLAFPLGLALMVGAFVMVQGRIDRKDAKLALAPIDSEQDLLSFQ